MPTKIANGPLVELVALAVQMPDTVQPLIYITLDGTQRRLSWPNIADLARRADRPVMI